jgi:hypothetical protein
MLVAILRILRVDALGLSSSASRTERINKDSGEDCVLPLLLVVQFQLAIENLNEREKRVHPD